MNDKYLKSTNFVINIDCKDGDNKYSTYGPVDQAINRKVLISHTTTRVFIDMYIQILLHCDCGSNVSHSKFVQEKLRAYAIGYSKQLEQSHIAI